MGQASDDIKLTPGSLIEISRLPGYVLQTKGECYRDELVYSDILKVQLDTER